MTGERKIENSIHDKHKHTKCNQWLVTNCNALKNTCDLYVNWSNVQHVDDAQLWVPSP